MNTLERRLIVKDRVIDAVIAGTAVKQSRRKRAEAAKKLRKDLAASRFASIKSETVSYPRHAVR